MNYNGNNNSMEATAAELVSDLQAAVSAVKTRIKEIEVLANNEGAGAAENELEMLQEALHKACAQAGGRRRRHARKTHRKRHTKRHSRANKKSRKNRKH
jgi:hypothetical protein